MRKRLVIAAIAAVVVVGIVAYVLSRPKKGSIEWREREWWAARSGKGGAVGLIQDVFGMQSVTTTTRTLDDQAQLMAHEKALLNSGRLVERLVLVSNQSPDRVLNAAFVRPIPLNGQVSIELTATNAIRLLTRSNDAAAQLSAWETWLRQADASLAK
jgi:hypothetical protein